MKEFDEITHGRCKIKYNEEHELYVVSVEGDEGLEKMVLNKTEMGDMLRLMSSLLTECHCN